MGAAAEAGTLDLRQFKHKAVRDLAWLLHAPPLLTKETGLDLLCDPPGHEAAASTHAWLRRLDAEPSELITELRGQTNVRRLGFYAAALTEYWLRHGPNWSTSRLISSVPLTAPTEKGKPRTAGQLKFVCLRESEILHVESSLKFFVDAAATDSALAEAATMSRFVGPFLHENFAWRLAEARRKLRCTESGAVRAYLQAQLGEAPLRSAYFLKGFIFRPLRDFRPSLPWRTPPELNGGCPVGWYTSDLEELAAALRPGALVAVLPKLFWLGPAEAQGEPPALHGCAELPGQEEPVPAQPWEAVEPHVRGHFERHDNALLLCELLPSDDDEAAGGSSSSSTKRWVEASRGFFLPPSWDPVALITDGPTGMRTSSEMRPGCALEGFADTRGRFSDRFADAPRAAPPDLVEAEIREGPGHANHALASSLGRDLVASDLVDLVLRKQAASGNASCAEGCGKGLRLELRAALRAAELAAPGEACRLLCAALVELGDRGLPTQGHLALELLWRDEPPPAPDEASLNRLSEAALEGSFCPRLAMRALARFGAEPPPVAEEAAAARVEAALAAGDRHRLLGLVELLHTSSSLRGAALAGHLADAVDLVAAAPADATVIEHILTLAPELCEPIADRLRDTGQQRLAKRIGTPSAATPSRRSAASGSPAAADAPALALPASVKVVLVEDASKLAEVLARARRGGVAALDAEWRPYSRGRDAGTAGELRRVQLLQLAWPEVVYLLDLPALAHEPALAELLEQLLCAESGSCVVGYGLEGDLRHVANSYPEQACGLGPWRGVELAASCPSLGHGGGLGKLCLEVLGRRLEKALQCSDWAQRPLSAAQLRYAALDAWVLLPLLRTLLEKNGDGEPSPSSGFSTGSSSGGELCLQDALAPEALAAAAASRREALAREGAAAVAAALRGLGADRSRARLVPSGELGEEGAAAVNCKTLACVAVGEEGQASRLALCVLPASAEADFALLSKALGSGREVRLATAEELRRDVRQPRGSVGPVGPALAAGAVVVLDSSLASRAELQEQEQEEHLLECGGGAPGWQLCISPSYLRELTAAVVAPIALAGVAC